MSASRPLKNASPDAPLEQRLPVCRGCGYDLRGGPIRGQCPECGRAFDLNTGTGLARPSPRHEPALTWMDRLTRYAGVLFWALIGLTILSLFLLIDGPTLRTAIVALSLLLAATLIVVGKMTWTVIHGESITDAELGPNLIDTSRHRSLQENPFDPTLEHTDGIELEGDGLPDEDSRREDTH